MKSPLVLIIYKRPETAARVIEAVRPARPERLYVLADGPAGAADEAACMAARRVVEGVDWPCEVVRLYSAEHLGIKRRVESGMAAVFEREEQAIILEDDCVPDLSFFAYCDELLARFGADERVMSIGGSNNGVRLDDGASYHFSRYALIWGWATWRRAWQRYDGALSEWPALRDTRWLADRLGLRYAVDYWRGIFEREYRSGENWDYAWTFSCWRHDGLCIVPTTNMISNIGFGPEATHTKSGGGAAAMPAAMPSPLRHPAQVIRDAAADEAIEAGVFSKVDRRSMLAAARAYLSTKP